ncbi:MAG TPA: hypothetical protein VI953_02500 [Candidatus Paceibacterota bacterium]
MADGGPASYKELERIAETALNRNIELEVTCRVQRELLGLIPVTRLTGLAARIRAGKSERVVGSFRPLHIAALLEEIAKQEVV